MKQKINHYIHNYIWILSLLLLMVVFFQNCSVYKSDGKRNFESLLSHGGDAIQGCLPYIDYFNVVAPLMDPANVQSVSVDAYPGGTESDPITYCAFTSSSTTTHYPEIDCDMSASNLTKATLRSTLDACSGDTTCLSNALYPPDLQISILQYLPDSGTHQYPLFSGTNSFAVVYFDQTQNQYGLKYFAGEIGKSAGSSCTILETSNLANVTDVNVLARISQEMAHNAN